MEHFSAAAAAARRVQARRAGGKRMKRADTSKALVSVIHSHPTAHHHSGYTYTISTSSASGRSRDLAGVLEQWMEPFNTG